MPTFLPTVPIWSSTCVMRPRTWSRTSHVPEIFWLKRCVTSLSTCLWTPRGGRRWTSRCTVTCRSSTGSWTTSGGTRQERGTGTNPGSVTFTRKTVKQHQTQRYSSWPRLSCHSQHLLLWISGRCLISWLVMWCVCLLGHWLCVLCCLSVVGFAWLVMWCLSITEPSNVISILISSEFLKMDTLVSVVTLDADCVVVLRAPCFSDALQRIVLVKFLFFIFTFIFIIQRIGCFASFKFSWNRKNKRPTDSWCCMDVSVSVDFLLLPGV